MTSCQKAARPLTRCLQNAPSSHYSARSIRSFTGSSRLSNEAATTENHSPVHDLDPATVTSSREERQLMKAGIKPIGSRRRRAALRVLDNIPFEQLPYQCFQEARKILQADREEKLKEIAAQRVRVSALVAQDPEISGGERQKQMRLDGHLKHLEWLKIQADINDPLIKKRFEDGEGIHSISAG